MSLPPWLPIQAPYMHGYERTQGDRHAKIVRHYAGEWHVWASLTTETALVRDAEIGGSFRHWMQARAAADRWLARAPVRGAA